MSAVFATSGGLAGDTDTEHTKEGLRGERDPVVEPQVVGLIILTNQEELIKKRQTLFHATRC